VYPLITPDGYGPTAGLTKAIDGTLIGTTVVGGPNNGGAVFKVTPLGTPIVLFSFGAGSLTDNPGAVNSDRMGQIHDKGQCSKRPSS
jgi:uncharacterized repeat protein (TIGR03803 family)